MSRRLLVAAGICILVALPLILVYETIGPNIIAGGDRPLGSTDNDVVATYYSAHPDLDRLTLVEFTTVPLVTVFVAGLAWSLWPTGRARLWVAAGAAVFVAEIPLILANAALQAAIAKTGGDSVALFRTWDVLWNSGGYVLEAMWVFAFAMATQASGRLGLAVLGFVAAALLAFNVIAFWTPLPAQAALPANLAFSVWMVANAVRLFRMSGKGRSISGATT